VSAARAALLLLLFAVVLNVLPRLFPKGTARFFSRVSFKSGEIFSVCSVFSTMDSFVECR
jgi:hypothetical protein